MRISIRHRQILILSTFMAAGFLLRFYFALTLRSGWDGGTYLYHANLINNGALPYRDFFIRDPVYIYFVALSARILGSNFLAISLVSTIPSIASVPILYLIVRESSDSVSGLVAAGVYSLAPTVIWYSTVFDERSLMLLLSSIAMLMLIKGLRKESHWFLVYYGLILGVGTFVYRGIAIYIVALPLLLAYLAVSDRFSHLRRFLKHALASMLSYGLSAGAILLAFGAFTSVTWMISSFGFSGQAESAGWFIWGQTSDFSFKERIFHVAVREWLYLIVPAGIFFLAVVTRKLSRWRSVSLGGATGIAVALLVLSVNGSTAFPQTAYGAYEPTQMFEIGFIIFLVILASLCVSLFPSLTKGIYRLQATDLGYTVALYWFLSTALLILLFGVPLVNYYYYFAPSLTVMASPVIRTMIQYGRSFRWTSPKSLIKNSPGLLILGVLLANAVVTTGMLLSTDMTWRNQPSLTVDRIASYVESRTNGSDEILSGNPAIALFAHRREILGISMLQMYGRTGPEPFDPLPDDPFHLFPNVTQISQEMDSGRVRFVVGDPSPPVLIIMQLHPMWEQSFEAHFSLETTIDGLPIYSFNGG